MSNTYGHGPLAEHVEPAEFARLIQHLDSGDLRFAGCRGDCMQGRKPCSTPGACYIAPAESATEIGADPGTVRSMRHYASARDALRALGIVAAIALAVILAAHLVARMGWLA